MAIIKHFRKDNNLGTLIKKDNDEYILELRRHRARRRVLISLVLIVIAMIAAGVVLYFNLKQYTDYTVTSSVERNDETGTNYMEFQGNLLKYNQDGISYVDSDNHTIWNQSFEMKEPIIDTCENYIAIASIDGSKVYILNTDGYQGEIDTVLPIQKIRVANQGAVMTVLEDDQVSYMNYYDKTGKVLAESHIRMENTGFPLDVSLSNDGKKMAVSYLYVSGGSIKTEIGFYNYDSVGENETDHLVSSYSYDSETFSRIKFVDNNTAIAFGNSEVIIYNGEQIPKETTHVPVEEEIKTIFYSDSYFGLVFSDVNGDIKYRLKLYDLDGDEQLDQELTTDYKTIKMVDNKIIVFGNSEMEIYNTRGRRIYRGKYSEEIDEVIPQNLDFYYTIVSEKAISNIRLK